MNQKKSEDAVSPVIGVMLMLVVTIVIAAVVAVFASGVGMDAEPAPATAVDVVGISVSEESTTIITYEYGLDNEKIRAEGDGTTHDDPSWKGKDNNFKGDASGNEVTGGKYTYYYVTKNGVREVFARKYYSDENEMQIYEPYGNTELGNKYLSSTPYEETITVTKPTLTLSSLHGDALDLSKVSVKVSQYFSSGATQPYEYEMPKNSISGTLSPGETLPIVLPNSEKIRQDQVVDLVVYYAGHKIAEEENLKVKRG